LLGIIEDALDVMGAVLEVEGIFRSGVEAPKEVD
jgi:hypothetical protein